MTAPWSLRSTAREFARGWHAFFHAPCDARILAAVRIVYALLVLIHLAVLYPDLDRWFTASGVLPIESSREITSPFGWSILWELPDTPTVVQVCFWIAVAHTLMLLIGFLPRLNALWLFVWLVSFQFRNTVINDGQDNVLKLLAFFLIWMPTGHCWSVDAAIYRWWHRKSSHERPSYEAPGWGLRLFQIEMALIMLSTGLMKLSGGAWVDGTALYYVSRLDDHFGRFPVPAWLFDTPWVVAAMTWSVLLAELLVPLLIWFRETRLVCLLVMVGFHLANEWTMNLFLFHWLMLCGWIAFLTPADFRWLTHWRVGARS